MMMYNMRLPRLQGVTATAPYKSTSSKSLSRNINNSNVARNYSHGDSKPLITCDGYYQGRKLPSSSRLRSLLLVQNKKQPMGGGMTAVNKIGSYSLFSRRSGRNLCTSNIIMARIGTTDANNIVSVAGGSRSLLDIIGTRYYIMSGIVRRGDSGTSTITSTIQSTLRAMNSLTNVTATATDNGSNDTTSYSNDAHAKSIKVQPGPADMMGQYNDEIIEEDDDYGTKNNRLVWLQEQMQKQQQQQQQQQQSLTEINQQTKTILSLPVGSFTSDTMEQCLRLMEYYTRHSGSDTDSLNNNCTVQENMMYHNANQMTHILKRIIEENLSGNSSVYFHPAMAETVCLYWRQVSPLHCPAKTLEILQHVRNIVQDTDIPYNNIISILAKCRNRHAALAVEGILWKMIELEHEGEEEHGHVFSPHHMKNHADIVTYNSAISSWMHIAKSEKDAGQRAVAILNRLRDNCFLRERVGGYDGSINMRDTKQRENDESGKSVKPNILSFSMAITALLRAEGSRAALQAEDILQDFVHFYQNEGGWTNHDENHSKDEIVLQEHIQRMFENILEALCQRAVVDTEAAERAVRMLRYMDSKAQDFGELIVDSNTYNMVLHALAKQSSTSSISTIQDIISEMNQSYQSGRNDKAIVNTQTYNALIKAYVKNGDEKSAQATLYEMLHQYHEENDHVRPDSVSWNLVIEAHAESAHEKAAHNISIILDKMHDFGKKHSDVQPDKITMSSVLKTLVRKASSGSRHAGKQAVQILDRMIEAHQKGNMLMKPDRIIFSSVINCIAKCGGKDAGSEALRILNRMQNMYKDGDLDLRPDTVTINTTLSALANTETRESALRSEHLLEAMITGDDPIMTPNVKSYTLVISAWAKSGARESLEKIEKLLLDMEKVDDEAKPNTFTYSTVLNAFAKSTDPSSYDRAIRVLQRMESGAIDVVPNSYCYASVMECISKSPDKDSICSRTIALLQRLIQQNKRNHICRDSYTVVFNTAIKAIERSSQEKKDRIALQILTLMKEANDSGKIIASPNARTYNSIIRACAFTTGSSSDKELAFDTAMSALDSIRSSKVLSPDLFTYPAIFRAGEELLPFTENNLERYRALFHMACEDGLVDALLLKNMVNLLPKVLLRSLLGTEKDPSEVRLNDLPREWRRNIYKGKALGRKSGRNNYVDEK